MKFVNLHITIFLFSLAFFISCDKTFAALDAPNAETIRAYVHASEAYSQGRFNAASEILTAQNKFPLR